MTVSRAVGLACTGARFLRSKCIRSPEVYALRIPSATLSTSPISVAMLASLPRVAVS